MAQSSRPLAPHLQIYKLQLTSVLSIMHRLTGLFLITLFLGGVAWLWALALGESFFNSFVHLVFRPLYGKVLVMGWCIAFCFHLANGLRHLLWDAGYGYDLKTVYMSGWAVLVFTAILSSYLILKILY